MKCLATIVANLRTGPLGCRSRLAESLAGVPLLRRTVEQVRRSRRVSDVCVIAPADQHAAIGDLLAGLDVALFAQAGPPPYTAIVRAGRIWNPGGWRGGIGSLCCFDEDIDLVSASSAALKHGADAVASIPAAAPLLDPALLDAMIAHLADEASAFRFTFTCAPPGLAGLIMGRDMIDDLAPTGQPPGAAMTYQPDRPFADLTGREPCFRGAVELVEARGRVLADMHRSWRRVEKLLAAGAADWRAVQVAQWLIAGGADGVDECPEEIEIELTTDWPGVVGPSLLRPCPPEFPGRGPISLEAVRAVAGQIGEFDDVRVVLGGFGEPCLHPRFADVCGLLREAGAAAVAVRTTGRDLPAAAEEALFAAPVDAVEVMLDAATPQTYARVHGVDAFDEVIAVIDRWLARREAQGRVLPVVVPSFVKARQNLDDMETFFDDWHRRIGTALVTGYSHCAGQRPDHAVTCTAPSPRGPCRRAQTRTLVLADGRMTTCDQDFAGRQTVGHVMQTPLRSLWRQSPEFVELRTSAVSKLPLCGACAEWHRP